MYASAHLAVGAVFQKANPDPKFWVPACLLSHFFLDNIWIRYLGPLNFFGWAFFADGGRVSFSLGENWPDILILAFEIAFFAFLVIKARKYIAGALVSLSPDFLWLPYHLGRLTGWYSVPPVHDLVFRGHFLRGDPATLLCLLFSILLIFLAVKRAG